MRKLVMLFTVAATPLVLACGRNAEEMQLDEMREALTHVEEENSFGEKLTAKELNEIVKQSGTRPQRAYVANQRTVQLDDGSEEESVSSDVAGFEATDDPNPRPVLRVKGIPHARDVVEETLPDENSTVTNTAGNAGTVPRPSAIDPEARKAYDAALALVNGKNYAQALDAFAAFMLKYPDHPYVENAMFWRGECYFSESDYVRAVEQLEGVIARFPSGAKTPDALLKLGLAQQKLGNPQKAKAYFDKLTHDYPRSDAARRIPENHP